VQFQQGKWVIASHYNYRVDIGDRLAKTAAALMYLKKDMVRSDSTQDHAKYGVGKLYTVQPPGRGSPGEAESLFRDIGVYVRFPFQLSICIEVRMLPSWRCYVGAAEAAARSDGRPCRRSGSADNCRAKRM
jgi:hypothetical protein